MGMKKRRWTSVEATGETNQAVGGVCAGHVSMEELSSHSLETRATRMGPFGGSQSRVFTAAVAGGGRRNLTTPCDLQIDGDGHAMARRCRTSRSPAFNLIPLLPSQIAGFCCGKNPDRRRSPVMATQQSQPDPFSGGGGGGGGDEVEDIGSCRQQLRRSLIPGDRSII